MGDFLDALASANPTPGGGSSAALSGAAAASLVSMVCLVMIENKSRASTENGLRTIFDRAEELRHKLANLIPLDGAAYKASGRCLQNT